MNHELKDVLNDVIGEALDRYKHQLANALGYGFYPEGAYLGTWDDLISIVTKQTRQLAEIRKVVL